MARGQKYNIEDKEKALAMLATNNNVAEIAKKLDIPESTLKTWKKEKENDEEFNELRLKKKREFVDKAWASIEMALQLGEKRIKRALEHESELDEIIDVIQDNDMNDKQKTALISKVRTLQIQGIRDISTFIGTLYDKQALANNEATNNLDIGNKDNKPFEVITAEDKQLLERVAKRLDKNGT
jgi:uncharacterized protein YifN (PemK superfamily)